MKKIQSKNLNKIVTKLEEFMVYSQKLKSNDTYLIINRNSPELTNAAQTAAENLGLDAARFDLLSKKPYKVFPKKLLNLLQERTPKAGISLFNYDENPDWNLKEVGARINFLYQIIEQVPISWAHSPGITMDMAINGPLQCNYKQIAKDSDKLIAQLKNKKRIHISAPAGTNIEIKSNQQIKFDTDCTIIPPNVYGKPGKFGNLPVGELHCQKSRTIQVLNNKTKRKENQPYPLKQVANGTIFCDVTVGGYTGKIDPEKPLIAHFKDGILTKLECKDPALNSIKKDILSSQKIYGLPTVLEEIGIGLNEKARITGNMLEDEKIKGTCHLALGNIRSHVDMLINKPTITVEYQNGTKKQIITKGQLT